MGGSRAIFQETPISHGKYAAFLGFVASRIGQDDSPGRLFLGFQTSDDDFVTQRFNFHGALNAPPGPSDAGDKAATGSD